MPRVLHPICEHPGTPGLSPTDISIIISCTRGAYMSTFLPCCTSSGWLRPLGKLRPGGKPRNPRNYIQETGRCARDGEPGKCIALVSPKDLTGGPMVTSSTICKPWQVLGWCPWVINADKLYVELNYIDLGVSWFDCLCLLVWLVEWLFGLLVASLFDLFIEGMKCWNCVNSQPAWGFNAVTVNYLCCVSGTALVTP